MPEPMSSAEREAMQRAWDAYAPRYIGNEWPVAFKAGLGYVRGTELAEAETELDERETEILRLDGELKRAQIACDERKEQLREALDLLERFQHPSAEPMYSALQGHLEKMLRKHGRLPSVGDATGGQDG